MDVPILHRMGNEFDERNLWLQLLLGCLSAATTLDAFLDRHAPPRTTNGAEPVLASSEPGDDVLIAFVLGLVAARNHLHAELERAAEQEPSAPRSRPVVDRGRRKSGDTILR